jgi:formylmethanofuran dehydrogenase subunit C
MESGTLIVHGSSWGSLGKNMKGGRIEIDQAAFGNMPHGLGNHIADNMRGGEVIVHGSAIVLSIGYCMSGGIVRLKGSFDCFCRHPNPTIGNNIGYRMRGSGEIHIDGDINGEPIINNPKGKKKIFHKGELLLGGVNR